METDVPVGRADKGEIEIRKAVIAYENRFARLYDDEVLFPSGVSGTYLRLEWKGPYSIGVVPVTADGKCVMIRSFRHGARAWTLEIPKGGPHGRQRPEAAAERELLEETGMTSSALRLIRKVLVDPALHGMWMHLFLATDCVQARAPAPESTEAIAGLELIDVRNLPQLLRTGRIEDAITNLAIYDLLNADGGINS